METANKVIVALILCFIFITAFMTWLAVRVRYYRIANANLKNRLETADKDVKDAYDSLDNVKAEFDLFRTQSAKIINTSTENNSRLLIELNKAKEDNAKLFDIAKGAVAKLAEMNTEVDRILESKNKGIKVGDYISGLILGCESEGLSFGYVTEISKAKNPLVNGMYLKRSTCKKAKP